jgi:O-antigen/teichoic acid export membrane protein
LSFLRGNVETGLFHGAYKILQGFMFVGESMVTSVFPVLARHYVGAKESLDRVYERTFRLLAVSGGFLSVLLFAFSNELILLILGKKYIASGKVLEVFSSAVIFMFLTKLAERMLIVGKRQLVVTVITVFALVLNVVFDLVLIPKIGIIGASIATLVAEVGLFVAGLYCTDRFVSDAPVYVCTLKVLFVYGVTCCLVALSVAYTSRPVGFVCGPLVYLSGVLILRLLPLSELYEMKDRIVTGMRLQTRASRRLQ